VEGIWNSLGKPMEGSVDSELRRKRGAGWAALLRGDKKYGTGKRVK
jgi:hypothetical protein